MEVTTNQLPKTGEKSLLGLMTEMLLVLVAVIVMVGKKFRDFLK